MIETNYISRDSIIDNIKPFIGKDVIKVITGQRRVGKSFCLKQIQDNISAEAIYINKELFEFDFIKNYQHLIEYVESKQDSKVLFIDEIQDIEEFEKALRHFQAKGGYDIYCTGSNAKLLSGELATYLSGRYVQFEIHSLSFNEFNKFHADVTLDDYFIHGGMPYLKNLELKPHVTYQYLKSVYESIILKDVVERYGLRNVKFLENLTLYLCNNIGSLTTSNNIAKFLKSQKININVTTVMNYIEALKNCFFIYEVPRYDIKGKRFFEINHKYYVEDVGIRNAISGYNQAADEAKLMENLVFMHLKRRGYDISIGVLGDKEIDFVCKKDSEKIYIQVALTIENDDTFNREFGNLLAIEDNYPKLVITKNANSLNSVEGVRHISLEEFFTSY